MLEPHWNRKRSARGIKLINERELPLHEPHSNHKRNSRGTESISEKESFVIEPHWNRKRSARGIKSINIIIPEPHWNRIQLLEPFWNRKQVALKTNSIQSINEERSEPHENRTVNQWRFPLEQFFRTPKRLSTKQIKSQSILRFNRYNLQQFHRSKKNVK